MPPTFLYLHGFASGPQSTKARYFADHLRKHSSSVLIPDLNQPSFADMTLTSQLRIIHDCLKEVEGKELVIVGSSMGGLLAVLMAQDLIPLSALILLAPGFGLPRRWLQLLGDHGLNDWQNQGSIEVFHYGLNANARLNYNFIVDAQAYKTDQLKVAVPTIIFHGQNDETVPLDESIDFKENNSAQVTLEILDDDHQLIKSLDHIWLKTKGFLEQLKS